MLVGVIGRVYGEWFWWEFITDPLVIIQTHILSLLYNTVRLSYTCTVKVLVDYPLDTLHHALSVPIL